MSVLHKYRVFCTDSNAYRFSWVADGDPAPTTCPDDPVGHTIDQNRTAIVETAGQQVKLDAEGKQIVEVSTSTLDAPSFVPAPRKNGAQFIDVTHNWADKTTWHTNAVQKSGVTLTQDTGKIYHYDDPTHGVIPFWIAFGQRKIYRDVLRYPGRQARVWDNGAEVVVAGFGQTKDSDGVDCEVDHRTGKVTFNDGYSVTGPVTASFWHVDPALSGAKQSEYIIEPNSEKVIIIERAEVQFTKGVDIRDIGHFAAFTYLYYYAVQADATLDPAAYGTNGALTHGLAFLITDKDQLHANFGTIEGLENGDVVFYATDRPFGRPDAFVVWFDASENAAGVAMNALAGSDPFPTVKTWDGSSWSAEGYGAPEKHEIPDSRVTYDSFEGYMNDATGNYSIIPADFVIGDAGVPHDILQFRFNWRTSTHLDGSLAVDMRVWLENGVEYGPDSPKTHFASGTFYGQIVPKT